MMAVVSKVPRYYAVWLVLAIAFVGCFNHSDVDPRRLSCKSDNGCPPSYQCVASICCKSGSACGLDTSVPIIHIDASREANPLILDADVEFGSVVDSSRDPSGAVDVADGSISIGGTGGSSGSSSTGGIAGSGTGGIAGSGSGSGGIAGSGSGGSSGNGGSSGSGGSPGTGGGSGTGSGGNAGVTGSDGGLGTGGLGSGGTGMSPDAARDVPISTPDAPGSLGLGSKCTSATNCTSGFCADGYCCDKACAGSCQACDLAASLGTCTTLSSNTQPHANRAACVASDATCAGRCNGTSGDCFYPPATTTCGTASCTSGVYQAAGTCNGGACGLPSAQTCPNLCITTAPGCVDCTTSSQCADPTKPICQGNLCVSCATASSGVCGAKDSTKPTCDSGTGKCVACTSSNQCTTATKPICGNGQTCVACGESSAPTNGCFAKNGSLAACNPTSGSCVECTANSHCATSGKPVCNTSTNTCVQCTDNSQCGGTTPICSSNTCVACTADAQCVAKLGANPGVCMSHQDGRCATDAETIYAEYMVGCATTIASGGTATTPYCDAVIALGAVSATRRLLVVRGSVGADISYYTPGLQLTVVGQLNAKLFPTGASPSCAVVSNGADLYMRDLICNTNYNADAIAAHSATLHLLRMVLFDSAGGLFLDSSNFEIVDTILSNNSGYGIRVNNPPATGLKSLQRLTFKDINSADITCTGPIAGVGVYAPDNSGISAACGIATCSPVSTSCGSSLTWVSPN